MHGMSAVYIINRIGPRTDPCGTPCTTIVDGAVIPAHITAWWRFVKEALEPFQSCSSHVVTSVQTLNKNDIIYVGLSIDIIYVGLSIGYHLCWFIYWISSMMAYLLDIITVGLSIGDHLCWLIYWISPMLSYIMDIFYIGLSIGYHRCWLIYWT